jgi:hypothetical protein
MILDKLEESVHLICGYVWQQDESALVKLLDPEFDFMKEIVLPFKKELNSNLLIQTNNEGRTFVIKHYLFELRNVTILYEVVGYTNELEIITKSPKNYLLKENDGSITEMNELKSYFINAILLFRQLWNEITASSLKYNIDLNKICNEIKFPTEHLDIKIFEHFGIEFKKNEFLTIQEVKNELPEIDLKTLNEKIILLYELGIIDFLIKKYPNTLKGNNNQVAELLSKIIGGKLQPSVNALLTDNRTNKNYPKLTNKVKAIVDSLNSNENK